MTNYRLSALGKSFWVGACSAGLGKKSDRQVNFFPKFPFKIPSITEYQN